VIVDYTTLVNAQGARGATLGFGTVISGAAARMLGCDGSISRIITGPEGQVLDSGRATRSFTAAQRRAIITRDRHCQHGHCDTPAAWCDIHHKVHWADSGPTSIDNGEPALRPPPPPHPPPPPDRHRPTRRPMTSAAGGWQPEQVELETI
jgi:hypothetical protein